MECQLIARLKGMASLKWLTTVARAPAMTCTGHQQATVRKQCLHYPQPDPPLIPDDCLHSPPSVLGKSQALTGTAVRFWPQGSVSWTCNWCPKRSRVCGSQHSTPSMPCATARWPAWRQRCGCPLTRWLAHSSPAHATRLGTTRGDWVS
jgi:hypothetical protein